MSRQQSSPKNAVRARPPDQRERMAVVCLVLAAITFAVFGQTLRHAFINCDDNTYVYKNPVVTQGLTPKGIVWAFTGVHAFNWHPLTWLSHMLDCQLYGLNPAGHHLTNVLLHTATVIVLFLVLRQMTGALWRSAFVAAVFAIHPLRVESVAWVAERKDVLSGLFFMLTIGAYVRYARLPRSLARYGLVMLLFALGLLCKPMLVTLPVVLLLLDYWPLRRKETAGRLILEKLPLLALSAASCAATLFAQSGDIQSTESYPMRLRYANALMTCMVYLGQMVWPTKLAAIYPYPIHGPPAWEVRLAVLLLAGFSALAIWRRRTQPWLLIGWLWYLVMLLPVLGIIKVGEQAHADRYTYLPQIGIYMAVTWLAAEWAAKLRVGKVVLGGLMIAAVAVLMVCAWNQTAYWKDGKTLWTQALRCTTVNCVAHSNLADALYARGDIDEGIAEYQIALHINPAFAMAHNNLGNLLLEKGRTDEAITEYQKALQFKPGAADFHYNLGNALAREGRVEEAIIQYQNVLQIAPGNAQAHNNLGYALLQQGKVDEAIPHFQKALQIDAGYARAHENLDNASRQKSRAGEATSLEQTKIKK